ncbi:rhomboid-like protein [Catenulispora yoronensis]
MAISFLAAYPRRNPVTFAYLLLVCAGLLVLGRLLPGHTADQLKIAISTNPHNMAHDPLVVLLASPLFAATDSGWISHILIIGGGVGVCMALLERRFGAIAMIVVFLVANTVATAVATSAAAAASIRAAIPRSGGTAMTTASATAYWPWRRR